MERYRYMREGLKDWMDVPDRFEKDMKNAKNDDERADVAKDWGKRAEKHIDQASKFANSQIVDNKSIVARARKSVLQFPIYVTESIRVNEAHIIAKLFERVYTTLVQTVLAQNPVLDEKEANNLVFLKKFHTNLKESTDIMIQEYKETVLPDYYEPIDEMEQMIQDSIFYQEQITPTMEVCFKWLPATNKDLIFENRRLMNEPLAGFSYLTEERKDNFGNKRNAGNKSNNGQSGRPNLRNKNSQGSSQNNGPRVYKRTPGSGEADPPAGTHDGVETSWSKESERIKITDAELKEMAKRRLADSGTRPNMKNIDEEMKKIRNDIENGKIKGYMSDGLTLYRINGKKKFAQAPVKETPPKEPVPVPKILKEADIKKINGMLPYTIEATFRLKDKNNKITKDVHYLIGIKSVMHLVRAEDLVDDLPELVNGNVKTFRKIKYKTGEIGFMDYMFNIKQIKKDAAKSINYNKKWVNTLKRLAEYEKLNGSLFKTPVKMLTNGDVPIPNGTLILSQPDVELLKARTGIDLSKVSAAKRLSKSLFLIAVCIVDGNAGSMKVLFPDNDTNWDVQSLASVDAELSKVDNSALARELNKMINQ